MIDAVLEIQAGRATRQIELAEYLDPDAAESCAVRANRWIKDLRHLPVDGEQFGRRFTFRGDSLWWFTELYLHKTQAVLSTFETIAALQALFERESPQRVILRRGGEVARQVLTQAARLHSVALDVPAGVPDGMLRLRAKASWLYWSALAARLRQRPAPRTATNAIAVFVHRAFWNADAGDGSAEAYLGPVLQALERREGRHAISYIGVGPRTNFRARRWWDPLRSEGPGGTTPIEAFAPLDLLRPSRAVWEDRHANLGRLLGSSALHDHARIEGCDAWPIVRRDLAGVALLQWPWSARVWDEADAAIDALRPRAVVTYAEAGGWGRALMLAARARQVPSVGIQHGFIYRHWLNYLHDPDELSPDGPSARGFPHPDATLVFDRYTAQHLIEAGHLPPDSIVVTGSARLDALVHAFEEAPRDPAAAGLAGVDADALVLLATKHREARAVLPALVAAVARIQGAHLAIKAHPAETPDVYRSLAAGRPHVSVLQASAPLARLLKACRVVVTVNSTVALDAAVLDVPALVIGLPNNLSPFVEAGVMAGARQGEIEPALRRILYDEEFRQQLKRARRAFLDRYAISSDGAAAERAAAAIVERALPVA